MKVSFITWYPTCRRSDTIARELGGKSHLIHYLQFKQPLVAPFKYVAQSFVTWRRLRADKPDAVFVASPPTFAVLAVWVYAKLAGAKLVIDAHTGLFDDGRWTWLRPINRFLARQAVATIVTNDHLRQIVEQWGGQTCVIGDVPVKFQDVAKKDLGEGDHVVVVNTFSIDEPIEEIIRAARLMPHVSFHITGNPKHARTRFSDDLPPNTEFTGWVSEDDYAGLLRSCDAVMCLTTHDHTMQRGAYEAMALGKPLVTSDWEILRQTFPDGTQHVDANAEAIRDGLEKLLADKERYASDMESLSQERRKLFFDRLDGLTQLLENSS